MSKIVDSENIRGDFSSAIVKYQSMIFYDKIIVIIGRKMFGDA